MLPDVCSLQPFRPCFNLSEEQTKITFCSGGFNQKKKNVAGGTNVTAEEVRSGQGESGVTVAEVEVEGWTQWPAVLGKHGARLYP